MKGDYKMETKFKKFTSVYDPSSVFYSLEKDGMEKSIDGIKFLEVTQDFKTVKYVRFDSLVSVGNFVKQL